MNRPSHPLRMLLPIALTFAVACGSEAPAPGDAPSTSQVGADLLGSRVQTGTGMPTTIPSSTRPRTDGPAPTLDDLGFTEGNSDAPVRIVEFSDFGCGYCRRFHEETFPTLHDEYIEAGLVEWKFVPMILGIFGPNSEAAAMAGECVGEQGNFAPMREALFSTQSTWKGADDPIPHFRELATRGGADVERWNQCMAEAWPDERVAFGTALSREAGVRGTPTFFIVGYQAIPGAIPLELFREVLDTVIARETSPAN